MHSSKRLSLLAELNRRQASVRDGLCDVASQYATGLYLFGWLAEMQ
jgi:hypothetical protein